MNNRIEMYCYVILVIFVIMALMSTCHSADMPKELKDGKIFVHTKGGKVYAFRSNEYMVVKRKTTLAHNSVCSKEDIIPCPMPKFEIRERIVTVIEKQELKLNRLSLLTGNGPKGLIYKRQERTVEQNYGLLFGGTYTRMLGERWGATIGVLNNGSVLMGVSFDF